MTRITTFCFCLFSFYLTAQSPWQSIDPTTVQARLDKDPARPAQFKIFKADVASLGAAFIQKKFDLPLPDGSLRQVRISKISNFHPDLAQRYSSIQTFEIESEEIYGRLDLSPHGLSGVYRWGSREVYLDALRDNDMSLVYFLDDYQVDPDLREMYTAHEHLFQDNTDFDFLEEPPRSSPFARRLEPVDLRQYDLALACTGEYAQKHGGTVEGALAAMNTALNRINFILETELSISLTLIADNDSLIFLDGESDPYSNGKAGTMAGENNDYLAANLVSNKYDLGHVFGTDCGNIVGTSGGIGTVCGTNKGFGSSCELNNPNPDRFYIGVVCHELGHQLGAEHTWNSCPTSDDSQFNSGTAFEPGSGTTIMSYAGACGDQNIAFSEDFYYHNNSLIDITTFVTSGGGATCAEVMAGQNNAPEVQVLHQSGFYIPISTPFRLQGSGTDPDGDTLTYTWEQYDAGVGQAAQTTIQNPRGNGPIFRSVRPGSLPERIIPELSKIITNGSDLTEVLPTYSRDLTFRLTARDNRIEGGAYGWDEVKFKATETAGPFLVSSFDPQDTLRVGDYVTVEWDVAGTDQAPVSCKQVNIRMSLNGGLDFPILLAGAVANDGAEGVLIPATLSSEVRFSVEAADNIFFDFNDSDMLIAEAQEARIAWDLAPHQGSICVPATYPFEVRSFSTLNFSDAAELIVMDAPAGVTVDLPEMLSGGDTLVLQANFSAETTPGPQVITLGMVSNGDTTLRKLNVNAVLNDFSDMVLVDPPNGAGNVSLRPGFSWTPSAFADLHTIEISTSPTFENAIMAQDLVGTNYVAEDLLSENTLHYWRLTPINACGAGVPSEIQAFHTISQLCESFSAEDLPQNLSQSQVAAIESKITVDQVGIISDVNLNDISGFHEAFGDLEMVLISPAGTQVVLLKDQCGFSSRQFTLGYDDESNLDFTCSTNFTGQLFRPEDSLDILIGEGTMGDWTLMVSDSTPGSGGMISGWNLELCGSIAVQPPGLDTDTLLVMVGGEAVIASENLLASSDNLAEDRLIYTVVTTPLQGTLLNDGVALQIGDQFSQEMISSGSINYRHDGADPILDQFTFTVIDQEGGWVPISSLPIRIGQSTSIAELLPDQDWIVYPNPSKHSANVELRADWTPASIKIIEMSGRQMWSQPWPAGATRIALPIAQFSSGTYAIQLISENGIATKKLMVW